LPTAKKRRRKSKGKNLTMVANAQNMVKMTSTKWQVNLMIFLNAFASVMDTENVDEFRFGPHLWKVNEFHVQPYMDFLDVDGPLHQLSSNSGLFECFLSLHSNLLVG
jgi:hypothetical protein